MSKFCGCGIGTGGSFGSVDRAGFVVILCGCVIVCDGCVGPLDDDGALLGSGGWMVVELAASYVVSAAVVGCSTFGLVVGGSSMLSFGGGRLDDVELRAAACVLAP